MCRSSGMQSRLGDDETMTAIGGVSVVDRASGVPSAVPSAEPEDVGSTDVRERPLAAVDLLFDDPSAALAQLDDPRFVLSEGYVGMDRRRTGTKAAVARSTFLPRRGLLRVDALIVLVVVVMLFGVGLLATNTPRSTRVVAPSPAAASSDAVHPRPHTPTTVPAPVVVTPPPVTVPPVTPPVVTADAATSAPTTPDAMGAAALSLVRYPWQKIPGYSIVFRPISEAPSPGFYGNTTFAWGKAGGVSTLYVYPGETVERLAAITAFEIGHEVDAAYVEPNGGHDQILSILGVHPTSWAPECDCGEQGYLSGWFAAAFSNYWSPGVGAWSTLAPEPSGALLAAMTTWLDPRTF